MNDSEKNRGASSEDAAKQIRQNIEHTRAEMTKAVGALETKLNPDDLRDKMHVELQHVEDRVRVVMNEAKEGVKQDVQEALLSAKQLVKEELIEAKSLIRDEMNEAENKIKNGLSAAKESVKQDIREAVTDAKTSIRAATIGKVETLATDLGDVMNETRETLVDTVKANPIPAALVGVGIVWLLMNRSTKSKGVNGTTNDNGISVRSVASGVGHAFQNAEHAVEGVAHQIVDRTTGAVQQISGVANSAVHGVSNAAHNASDIAGKFAHQTSESVAHFAHDARDMGTNLVHRAEDAAGYVASGARTQVRNVEQGFERTIQTNPLALGAAAVLVGAAVGFALPHTPQEDAWLGETRDRLVGKTERLASSAVSSVAQLAEKTAETAKTALEGRAS